VGEHVLRQPNELDAALDPDPLLLDRRAQDTLGLGLRNEQGVVIAAVDPREVEAKAEPVPREQFGRRSPNSRRNSRDHCSFHVILLEIWRGMRSAIEFMVE